MRVLRVALTSTRVRVFAPGFVPAKRRGLVLAKTRRSLHIHSRERLAICLKKQEQTGTATFEMCKHVSQVKDQTPFTNYPTRLSFHAWCLLKRLSSMLRCAERARCRKLPAGLRRTRTLKRVALHSCWTWVLRERKSRAGRMTGRDGDAGPGFLHASPIRCFLVVSAHIRRRLLFSRQRDLLAISH